MSDGDSDNVDLVLSDGGITLHLRRDDAAATSELAFDIESDGARVGDVVLQRHGVRIGRLTYRLDDQHRGQGIALRAVQLVVDYAFNELGLARVEAYVPHDDRKALRVASRSGLRREGVLRDHDDGDAILLARLAADPPANTRDGFIAMLNAGLPTKRVISQGLLYDERGRVLLCELTYKREWDLPGGVIESGEAPGIGLVREIAEELGIDVSVRGLRTVNWLPPWRGWDDACVFVFDLGVIDSTLVSQMSLQPTEIASVHWCDEHQVQARAAAATASLLSDLATNEITYREAGTAPGAGA